MGISGNHGWFDSKLITRSNPKQKQRATRVTTRPGPTAIINLSSPSSGEILWASQWLDANLHASPFYSLPFPRSSFFDPSFPRGNSHCRLNDASCRLRSSFRSSTRSSYTRDCQRVSIQWPVKSFIKKRIKNEILASVCFWIVTHIRPTKNLTVMETLQIWICKRSVLDRIRRITLSYILGIKRI